MIAEGEIATRWTIRLALLCYGAYLSGALAGLNIRWARTARFIWTAGCALFLAHVACAMHFYHGWSHAAALESTARETQELLGVRFGEGIYFSYLFAIVWSFDVVRLWIAAPAASRPTSVTAGRRPHWLRSDRLLSLAIHSYLLFMAINGAMVFEPGPTRWGGAIVCLLLFGLVAARAYNSRAAWLSPGGGATSADGAQPSAPCDTTC